jgi:FtsP/CotA-like multicopper oxidase with cupredoxin domain
MASNAENYIVRIAGHNLTLIALDGVDVNPLLVTDINMHIGERADLLLCADQAPGYYRMSFTYDYACSLEPGNFIPPGFHAVKGCEFYSMLQYYGTTALLPTMPGHKAAGTGGGATPRPVAGVGFDLTNAADWRKTQPIEVLPEPVEPDARFFITLGLEGPVYSKVTDIPLTKGRWYMDSDARRMPWDRPETPLLFTKGGSCGAEHTPVLSIPENATVVEIVLNNLSPNAHNVHLHGMLFQVINVADFEWCSINRTLCFLMPEQDNPCPVEDRDWGNSFITVL